MVARYRARTDLLTEKSEDALIVVDVRSRQVHEFNATAAWLWERLEHGCGRGELAEVFCHHYDVRMETAKRDVEKLLSELLQRELLVSEET